MNDPQPSDAAPATVMSGADDFAAWRPLPARALLLFVLGSALPAALVAGIAGGFVARGDFLDAPLLGALCGAAFGLAGGAWLGRKQYRCTFWRLDEDGLALRRGKFWQHETRVPTTRVQHLDLKRGPLQRRRSLATLVVHTAGTRYSAVSVPHLDEDDAQRLRDRLARQIDHDDEA